MPATTPRLALPYPQPPDPADVPADMQALATKLDAMTSFLGGPTSTLPASPVALQEVILDAGGGALWHLKWTSGSWYFLGGSPLYAEVEADEAVPAPQTSYQAMTNPVSVTIPRPGLYDIEFGASMYSGITTGLMLTNTGQDVPPNDSGSAFQSVLGGVVALMMMRAKRRSLAAAGPLRLYHRQTSAGALQAANRWLTVRPVAIN